MTAQPSQPISMIEPLTQRELEVMQLYANPFTEKAEITSRLSIAPQTLNNHLLSIYQKLLVTDRFSAAVKFLRAYPECRERVDLEIERAIRDGALAV